MYCYRKDFTEYIHHVGNADEPNSIMRNGLIPGGKSLKRGRQEVFFTTVNPMEDVLGMGETCDLTKSRIAPYKNTWTRVHNSVFWCNLELAQENGLQFYQTRSRAVVLYNTCSLYWESGVYENSGWALPQGSLNSESTTCRDPQSQDARSSWDPSNDSKSYGETWNTAVDYRISGMPLTTVEQQVTTREKTRSRSWSRSSRTTSTRNPSFRTWARRRRSTSSAKNRRTGSPTWTTPRSSNFAKILPNSNVLTAMPTGK